MGTSFKDFLLAERERKLSSHIPEENNTDEELSEDAQSLESTKTEE